MDIFTSFRISSSALEAQRTRLNTISSNVANIETTRTPEGGPFRQRQAVFRSTGAPFAERLDRTLRGAVQGVAVAEVRENPAPPRMVHDPSHPDANEEGYVAMPNIDLLAETADMMAAARAYEANVTVVKAAKRMALKALEIGR